jgi:hypothetical protein
MHRVRDAKPWLAQAQGAWVLCPAVEALNSPSPVGICLTLSYFCRLRAGPRRNTEKTTKIGIFPRK